jgi:hypothetical protein
MHRPELGVAVRRELGAGGDELLELGLQLERQ